MSDSQTIGSRLSDLAGLPRDESGPVFREPWEAQAFAIVQTLQQRGLFTPAEWSEALGAEIRHAQAAGDADVGDTYYQHWLAALECLVCEKGLTTQRDLSMHQIAWQRAARRVPHGQPIHLSDEDFI